MERLGARATRASDLFNILEKVRVRVSVRVRIEIGIRIWDLGFSVYV